MTQLPLRPLFALAFATLLSVSSVGALADTDSLTPGERRKFDKIVKKLLREERKDIVKDMKGIRSNARRILRDVKAGRLSDEEKAGDMVGLCSQIQVFLFPGEAEDDGEVSDEDRANDIVVRALAAVLPDDDDRNRRQIEFSIPAAVESSLVFELRALRNGLAVGLEDLKDEINERQPPVDEPEKFTFQRAAESHKVVSQPSGTELEFVRPGLQRIEVTEDGNVKVELGVAFDEPDSFVQVELKQPNGTPLSTFKARQSESSNGDSRTLKFEFTLDNLPAPGEPVLFTASSSFDESLLSLADPFDCLAFLFPGLVTPTPSE